MQCAGYRKDGSRCLIVPEASNIFCNLHYKESEIKTQESKRIVQLNFIHRNCKTISTTTKALEPEVLELLYNYVNIPKETSRVFDIGTSKKQKYIISTLSKRYNINIGKLEDTDTNLLYSALKFYDKINYKIVYQLIAKHLISTQFYDEYITKGELVDVAELLILVYSNKYFIFFKKYINLFIARSQDELKDEYKENYTHIWNENLQVFMIIYTLLYLEYIIVSKSEKFEKLKIHKKLPKFVQIKNSEAVEIYLQAHIINSNIKKLISDRFFLKHSPTWLYTLYLLDAEFNHSVYLYFRHLSYNYNNNFQNIKNLDLQKPIILSDISFFKWVYNLFQIYLIPEKFEFLLGTKKDIKFIVLKNEFYNHLKKEILKYNLLFLYEIDKFWI